MNDIKKVINDPPLKLEEVFVRLLSATSSVETEKLVKTLVDYYGGKWRLVGDRSNFPTIHTTSSAVISIVERITNAMDAQLEAEAVYSPKLKEGCKSPRQLVEKRFGVANGYLVSLENMKGKKERLVEDAGITITLRDGDAEDSSTIDVRDKGIGVAKEEFPDTLLSLNQNNKINKWYLMGRFGQGGSTTYRFSPYTVIFSRRRRSLHELENDIAFTIVKYREASEGEKDGQYVYLVRNMDDFPFSIPADNINFEGGTLVRHVAYSLGKKYLLDFYGYMETYLFDPILPFWLREERSWETNKGQGRRIFGSRDRLSRTDSVEQKDEFDAVLDQGDIGSIIVRYWVFKRGTQTKEKLTFIDPEEPIVITYLGQTHAKLPRRLLANDCQLPNLYKDLAVQIDCDGLTDKGRRVMFTSTREVITDEGRRLIKEALVNTLSEELAELDQQRQLEFLSEGVTKAKDEMRRKLAEMINRIRPGTFATSAVGTGTMPLQMKKTRKKRSRRSKPPLETKNFPTYVKIANEPEPLKFSKAWVGTWIEIESDAPDDYLSKAGAVLELGKNTQKFCHLAFKHKDFKGGRLYLKAGLIGDPTVGTTFPFCVSIRLNSNTIQNSDLEDCKTGIIVEPPSGGGEKKVPLDAPDIVAVKRTDPFWKESEWTEDNVAEVREGSNIVIYVSFGNKWLIGALSGSGYTLTKQELLRNKYLLHMAFYAYLQNKGLKDLGSNGLQKENLGQTQSLSEEMLDKIRQDSLEWAARAILTAITSEQAFSKAEAQIDEVEPD